MPKAIRYSLLKSRSELNVFICHFIVFFQYSKYLTAVDYIIFSQLRPTIEKVLIYDYQKVQNTVLI